MGYYIKKRNIFMLVNSYKLQISYKMEALYMKNKIFVVYGAVFILMAASFPLAVNASSIDMENKKYFELKDLSIHSPKAKWTVMMYIACDTALRYRLINFYQEVLRDVGSTDDFKIIALFDGKERGDTFYCYAEEGLLIPLPWYEEESNMASPENFERFLRLSMHYFPAEHYALFTLSDYGSGWQGVFSDTDGTGSTKTLSLITMPEVRQVLKNITENGNNKIDVWGIDVCIPGMVEVAYEISPYVKYMVANEEHGFEGDSGEEGYELGWNYSFFLQELKNNPDMSPEEFSTLIVNCYKAGTFIPKILLIIPAPQWYPITKFYTTLSAVNLSKINLIRVTLNTLASNLINNLNEVKYDIKKARQNTREYGKRYKKFWWIPFFLLYFHIESLAYDGFVDLYDFADKLRYQTDNAEIKDSCIDLMDAVNETIIANEALSTDPSYGLSIYFPKLKCQYDQSLWRGGGNPEFNKIPSSYSDLYLSQDGLWDDFLEAYLGINR